MCDRATDVQVAEQRILEVEGEVLVVRPFFVDHCKFRFLTKSFHHVRRQNVQGDVDGSFSQFERTDDGLGDDLETNGLDPWFLTIVVRTRMEHHLFILAVVPENKRARADRMLCEGGIGPFGHDADCSGSQVPQEGRKRFLQAEPHRVFVDWFNLLDEQIRAQFGRLDGTIED